MSLFMEKSCYNMSKKKELEFCPEARLLAQSQFVFQLRNILHEEEKAKIYELFFANTKDSRKPIKYIKIKDKKSITNIQHRIVTDVLKKINFRNNKVYNFKEIMPTMEIVEWPENKFLTGKTFNKLTKDIYIPKDDTEIIGTYIIPIITTTCSTLLTSTGKEELDIIECYCSQKCKHKPKSSCPCTEECKCKNPCRLHITEDINYFYTSDLEPLEIYGPTRLNLYIHLKFLV